VIVGDLLQSGSTEEDFEWFIETRKKAGIEHWFELAGNHDVRNQELFQKHFPRPSRYAVGFGNAVLLLMSDETPSAATDISDAAFEWWKAQVLAHPDRILLTATHAPLRHSGLFTAAAASRRIRNSKPFEDVLRQARVSLWASGHSHLPHGFYRTSHVNRKLGGTCFVNVAAIRDAAFKDSQSRILIFTEGSRTLWIRSRNHSTGRYNPGFDIALTLDQPFHGAGDGPRVLEE
jgi:3',5'-cyclic AMP phosphodiesterase CpdA